jgi:hypothetical protein
VHLQPLLGDRQQPRAARRDADLGLQPATLGDEARAAVSIA